MSAVRAAGARGDVKTRWMRLVVSLFVSAVIASQLVDGTIAFVGPKISLASRAKKVATYSPSKHEKNSLTELQGNTKQAPTVPMPQSITYGEESRKYRRTVYSHDDWIKHRAPDRYLRNAFSVISSGVYRNVGGEILTVTVAAVAAIAWNALTGDYVDFENIKHAGVLKNALPEFRLPLAPFTLSSASLGLLLVFRTNTGYQRWDEARKNWGMNINHTRDLVRMGTAWYDMEGVSPEKRKEDLTVLALATWSFVRSMKRHLSPASEDEEDFQRELRERLPTEQAEAIIKAAHRPNRALFDLSVAIENLPMHWLRKNEINKAVTVFENNLGSSERLLTSPVPLFYSRHTARFLFFWMLGLPLALYSQFDGSWNNIAMIPSIAVISTFLFGIEELANQMEEPFTILPMQAFCDKIYNWCTEIVSWEPGDNGMKVTTPLSQHKAVAYSSVNVELPEENGMDIKRFTRANGANDQAGQYKLFEDRNGLSDSSRQVGNNDMGLTETTIGPEFVEAKNREDSVELIEAMSGANGDSENNQSGVDGQKPNPLLNGTDQPVSKKVTITPMANPVSGNFKILL